MKRTVQLAIAVVLLGSITIEADPIIDWIFTQDYSYENGQSRDGDDLWTWDLECNDVPGQQGPPYEILFPLLAGPDSINDVDMAPLIQAGGYGQYWCAAATYSEKYEVKSEYSNEKDFIVTAQQTGFVPVAPTII